MAKREENAEEQDEENKLQAELQERTERVRELEIEDEEAILPRSFSKIYAPSKEEYDRHCLTHVPYRNWCPICVQAKGLTHAIHAK